MREVYNVVSCIALGIKVVCIFVLRPSYSIVGLNTNIVFKRLNFSTSSYEKIPFRFSFRTLTQNIDNIRIRPTSCAW